MSIITINTLMPMVFNIHSKVTTVSQLLPDFMSIGHPAFNEAANFVKDQGSTTSARFDVHFPNFHYKVQISTKSQFIYNGIHGEECNLIYLFVGRFEKDQDEATWVKTVDLSAEGHFTVEHVLEHLGHLTGLPLSPITIMDGLQ